MTRLIYEEIPIIENDEHLVDVSMYSFVIEPVYYQVGYSTNRAVLLRRGVAERLQHVQDSFDGRYRFKIWDAYRSRHVQNAIYTAYHKRIATLHPNLSEQDIHKRVETFVTKATDPKRIPPHATGGAVDLTLVGANGDEVDMGTPFDSFEPEAASMFYENNDISKRMRNNRRILREAMTAAGFRSDDDEWWHYDYGNQIWASTQGHAHAIYGEVALPYNT